MIGGVAVKCVDNYIYVKPPEKYKQSYQLIECLFNYVLWYRQLN
jgi:hypothetical protein